MSKDGDAISPTRSSMPDIANECQGNIDHLLLGINHLMVDGENHAGFAWTDEENEGRNFAVWEGA